MASESVAAVIGIIGVVIGAALNEWLQWIRRKREEKAKAHALRGLLIGLYYEIKKNKAIVGNLKSKIGTHSYDPDIISTRMLTQVRSYYSNIAVQLIEAIESTYADLDEIVHLGDTGSDRARCPTALLWEWLR